MEKSMPSQQLVLKLQGKDTPSSVSRKTLKLMAAKLGLDEIQLVHYALARLREDVMCDLRDDAPELSTDALKAIRSRYAHLERDYRPSSSVIEGL